MNMTPRFVSLKDAASVMGLKRTMMYSLLDSGELQSVKVGRRRLVTRASVDRFVDRLEGEAEGTTPVRAAG